MLHAREIRLGGKREEVVPPGFGGCEGLVEDGLVDPHVGQGERDVSDGSLFRPSEFADAVDGVVVVERQQIALARAEGVGFSDQLERIRRIGGKDGRVVLGRGVEVGEDLVAGAFDDFGHRRGGRVVGVRVAENVGFEQVPVLR